MKLSHEFFEAVKYCNCYDVEHFRTYDTEVLYVWEKGPVYQNPVIVLTLLDEDVSMTGRYFDKEDYEFFISCIENELTPHTSLVV